LPQDLLLDRFPELGLGLVGESDCLRGIALHIRCQRRYVGLRFAAEEEHDEHENGMGHL